MSSIGPSIPAHLIAKQPTPKNDPPEDNDSDDSDSFAPALPPDIILTQRVLGPSFPSGPPPEREDDSSDDDYGPAPLPEGVEEVEHDPVKEFMEKEERRRKNAEDAAKPQKLKRDQWMLVPPKASDLLSSMDPTKLKARQFSRNTEEKVTDNTLWTETPAQRLARLQDEASGKRKRTENAAATEEGDEDKKRRKRDKEIRKVVEQHNESTRSTTLLDMHAKATSSAKLTKEEEEEKAKAGVWDHGRDMGLGGRLMDEGKRKQIVNDAKGLSSRFGHGKSGGYL